MLGILLCASFGSFGAANASTYFQTDLVSDIPGLATITDPELMNPWGLSHSPTSPFWTSNQGTNTATLYAVTGSTSVTKTVINPPSGFVGIPGGPTGQVANTNIASFLVGGAFAHFIFGNLAGSIYAWNTGTTAVLQATTPGASYTGLTINQGQNLLYAANNAGTGGINVFNSAFAPVSLAGTFTDPTLPSGLVPFNVQDISGKIYVTYAPAGHLAQTMATLGQGVVSVFDENGNFLQQLITGGKLAAPWGVALAPSSFGQFAGDLLVGNFSYANSVINAFDPTTGAFEGSIPIDVGSNTPGGLWSLDFGTGGGNGSPNTLYFTDGLNGEVDGLFGAIEVTPIPATLPLFAGGLGFVVYLTRRKKGNAQTLTAA
jgi:uncharacterized protein (TIGR03118 family)